MNRLLHLTDSLPLDADGLNEACLRATAAAKAAEDCYVWSAKQTPGSFIARKIHSLARVHHAKAEALCALLERSLKERGRG